MSGAKPKLTKLERELLEALKKARGHDNRRDAYHDPDHCPLCFEIKQAINKAEERCAVSANVKET